MQTRIVDETQIDEKLDAELRRGLTIAFPKYEQTFQRHRYIACEPAYRVIIEDGEMVIAQVAIIDRTVTVGSEPLRVAGVGLVYVLPDYRKKGYSSPVLAASMEEAKRQGYDFGMLFTSVPKISKVYLDHGWVQILDRQVTCIESDDNEVDLGPERAKMYYVLDNPDFPDGDIHLNGNRW